MGGWMGFGTHHYGAPGSYVIKEETSSSSEEGARISLTFKSGATLVNTHQIFSWLLMVQLTVQ
jgi:hypothetical protein